MKLEGFDVPIFSEELDILERQRLAARIYDVTTNAPEEWSVRIGLFGKWGEGKTSVMKLVDNLAEKHGDIVVWFNPWSVKNIDTLWISFVDAIVAKLALKNIEVEGLTKVKWKRKIGKHVEVIQRLSEIHSVSKAVVGSGIATVQKYLSIDGKTLQNISTKLGNKRIVVFIDDLDRTDPSVLPQLLLGLREILDLPQFSYILGFDKDIVACSLSDYHPSWGTGHEFLEKIIDFPFSLPELSSSQILGLIHSEIKKYADFIDLSAIKKIEDLLPKNPRKLKHFIRRLSLLKSEVKRHHNYELEWISIFISELIRLESEVFLEKLTSKYLTSYNISWSYLSSDDKDKKKGALEKIENILEECLIVDDNKRKRLVELVLAWRKRTGHDNVNTSYQVKLVTEPCAITWKEFNVLFDKWKIKGDINIINIWAIKHASEREISVDIVATELFQTVISYRRKVLEDAASSMLLDEQEKAMNSAEHSLKLIGALYKNGLESVDKEFFRSPNNLHLIYGMAEYWIHFDTNQADKKARKSELSLLTEAIELVTDKHDEYIVSLTPWVDSHFHEKERKALRVKLASKLESAICEKAIELFSDKDGISWIGDYGVGDAYKYVLLRGESLIWQGLLRDKLKSKLSESNRKNEIHSNIISYVELLIGASQIGNSVVSREEACSVLMCSDIVSLLWDSLLSRKVQFRFATHIFKIRFDLGKLGVPDDGLIIPAWLEEAKEIADAREKADAQPV